MDQKKWVCQAANSNWCTGNLNYYSTNETPGILYTYVIILMHDKRCDRCEVDTLQKEFSLMQWFMIPERILQNNVNN